MNSKIYAAALVCLFIWCSNRINAQANTTLSNLASPTAVNRDLIPSATNSLSLGTASKSWKNIYVGNSIYLKNTLTIHAPGTTSFYAGPYAGNPAATGTYNSGFGYNTLGLTTTGSYNTALGFYSLYYNTTGSNNTASGHAALNRNTTGSNNTAGGFRALYSNSSGSDNSAYGYNSLYSNTSGSYNTANGNYALYSNTTSSSNTASGYKSLYSNTSGKYNTATGVTSLYYNTSGTGNTANGLEALHFNTTGNNNTATGLDALLSSTTGDDNTATGSQALLNNTTGFANTGTGNIALYSNTTGYNNTASGAGALGLNTTGYNNSADGTSALNLNSTGHDNTAVGVQALYLNGSDYNTSVGFASLFNNTFGYNNTALGISADVSDGNLFNATVIGANAIVNASNKIRLGDGGITVVESNAGSWTVSDGRFKTNIKDNIKGLEFIKLLKPVTYNFDTRKFEEFLMQNYPDSIRAKRINAMSKAAVAKASGIVQSGFVAQDVADAVKQSGYDFNGVHAPENSSDNWSLSYEKLVVPLVKAVQELSNKNDEKDELIASLKTRLEKLEALMKNTSAAAISLNDASLGQNNPNPFNGSTVISYNVPQRFTSAQLVVYDAAGKALKQVNIAAAGKGTLKLDAAALASGAYNYSLMVDGKLVDTKKMVLAK